MATVSCHQNCDSFRSPFCGVSETPTQLLRTPETVSDFFFFRFIRPELTLKNDRDDRLGAHAPTWIEILVLKPPPSTVTERFLSFFFSCVSGS